jgi:hypothetical protein
MASRQRAGRAPPAAVTTAPRRPPPARPSRPAAEAWSRGSPAMIATVGSQFSPRSAMPAARRRRPARRSPAAGYGSTAVITTRQPRCGGVGYPHPVPRPETHRRRARLPGDPRPQARLGARRPLQHQDHRRHLHQTSTPPPTAPPPKPPPKPPPRPPRSSSRGPSGTPVRTMCTPHPKSGRQRCSVNPNVQVRRCGAEGTRTPDPALPGRGHGARRRPPTSVWAGLRAVRSSEDAAGVGSCLRGTRLTWSKSVQRLGT